MPRSRDKFDEFPELDLSHLENYAKKWVNKYPEIKIKRVLLHRVSTQGQEIYREKVGGDWPFTKYAVVFEFSNCIELSLKNIWEKVKSLPFGGRINPQDQVDQDILITRFYRVLAKIENGPIPPIVKANDECIKFVREVNSVTANRKPHQFLDSVFIRKAYNERTPKGHILNEDNFRAEWHFGTAHVNDEYIRKRLYNTPYIQIYPPTTRRKEFSLADDGKLPEENIFRKVGDIWQLSFGGVPSEPLKHRKGMLYISYLISNPRQSFFVTELVKPAEHPTKDILQFSSSDVSDWKATSQYRQRLEENKIEKAKAERENDKLLIKELEKEDEAIRKQILQSIGMDGKLKKFPEETKRLSNAVSEAITRSLKAINKKHPKLYQHLKNSIKRGRVLIYDPETPVTWITMSN